MTAVGFPAVRTGPFSRRVSCEWINCNSQQRLESASTRAQKRPSLPESSAAWTKQQTLHAFMLRGTTRKTVRVGVCPSVCIVLGVASVCDHFCLNVCNFGSTRRFVLFYFVGKKLGSKTKTKSCSESGFKAQILCILFCVFRWKWVFFVCLLLLENEKGALGDYNSMFVFKKLEDSSYPPSVCLQTKFCATEQSGMADHVPFTFIWIQPS